jgi:2-oxoglutarate/2-oxoacid ferredoxin oxidoreductase subunit alpha
MKPVKTIYPDWSVRGAVGRDKRILTSIYLQPEQEEVTNLRLLETWNRIKAEEVRFREYYLEDAEIAVVGFGTAGRVSLSAVRAARAEGIKVGLLRPITLSPFPAQQISELAERVKSMLVVEMNSGQMLEDVRLAAGNRLPVEFYGRMGGVVPFPDEILGEIHRMANEPLSINSDPRLGWIKRLKVIQSQE